MLGLKDNIWTADSINLADMRSLSSFDWIVQYLLCVIDVFNKYPWVKPLKNKKAKLALHGFTKKLNEFKR